jgi:hypothetical protein
MYLFGGLKPSNDRCFDDERRLVHQMKKSKNRTIAVYATMHTVSPVPDSVASRLSRRHRAWIAFYSLESRQQERAQILRLNQVTEADLVEFEESWLKLRCRTPNMPQ